MDLWVVAAAAGAGYLAKYWQNLSRSSDNLSQLPSVESSFGNTENPSCPFRKLARRKQPDTDVSAATRTSNRKFSDINSLDGLSVAESDPANGFDGENSRIFGNYDDKNVLSLSNLSPVYSANINCEEIEGRIVQSSDSSALLHESCPGQGTSAHFSAENQAFLRTKLSHVKFVRPISSLESCLIAQLYKEHTEMKEYVLSSLPSPCIRTVRPFFVSDGSRIISREKSDSLCASIRSAERKLHCKFSQEKNENAFVVPSLPKFGLLELPKKMAPDIQKEPNHTLSTSSNISSEKYLHAQCGSTEGAILFFLGISVGIIYSVMANKRELDKLKGLLKQTEDLVEDLQEELEMKDSLTVKELNNENYVSLDACNKGFIDQATNVISPERHMDNSPKSDCKESSDKKANESLESLSKIEAELEAELERLDLNMNFSQIGSNFSKDFTQMTNMVNGKSVAKPKSDTNDGDTSTPHSANYAVPPLELSLRLHEVIQSRLEERVKELEIALEDSQRKVRFMESERKSNYLSGSGTPSNRETQYMKEYNSLVQPLIMNLSGEALDAYHEAYGELTKVADSEDESPSWFNEKDHNLEPCSNDWHAFEGQNGVGKEKISLKREEKTREEKTSSVCDFNDLISEDESNDCDTEMERQLIKQIVEMTKKGSPVVLNAQKLLHTTDINNN